jgi:hypothetical protein
MVGRAREKMNQNLKWIESEAKLRDLNKPIPIPFFLKIETIIKTIKELLSRKHDDAVFQPKFKDEGVQLRTTKN